MNTRTLLLSVVLLPLVFSSISQAQVPASASVPSAAHGIDRSDFQSAALSGKVAVEDGSNLDFDTAVVLQCGSSEHARAHVDAEGRFTVMLSTTEAGYGGTSNSRGASSEWADCELYAEGSGYRSEQQHISREQLSGVVQVGTLILRPVMRAGTGEGFAISAVSLAAPEKAKTDFRKGQEQAKKGKWAAAGDYFRRAVQVYPRYALAWLELGRAQMQQSNFMDAQQSFQQAATQDTNLLPAYMELAKVALEQKQWKSLADSTDHVLRLSPQSNPVFWFLNAAANFNMGDVSHAEASATRGLRLDANHKIPQLEYLYAMVLEREGKYEAAVEHIKTYLLLAPKADDAQQAQQKLAFIEKQLSDLQSSAKR